MTWTKSTPRKMDFALAWLAEHPGAMSITGRELERTVWLSQYRQISHRTWNNAKRLLRNQGAFPDRAMAA